MLAPSQKGSLLLLVERHGIDGLLPWRSVPLVVVVRVLPSSDTTMV